MQNTILWLTIGNNWCKFYLDLSAGGVVRLEVKTHNWRPDEYTGCNESSRHAVFCFITILPHSWFIAFCLRLPQNGKQALHAAFCFSHFVVKTPSTCSSYVMISTSPQHFHMPSCCFFRSLPHWSCLFCIFPTSLVSTSLGRERESEREHMWGGEESQLN